MKQVVKLEYPELACLMGLIAKKITATEKKLIQLKTIQDACERFTSEDTEKYQYLDELREDKEE